MNILRVLVNSSHWQPYETDKKEKASNGLPISDVVVPKDTSNSSVCGDLASRTFARIDHTSSILVVQETDLKLVNWGHWSDVLDFFDQQFKKVKKADLTRDQQIENIAFLFEQYRLRYTGEYCFTGVVNRNRDDLFSIGDHLEQRIGFLLYENHFEECERLHRIYKNFAPIISDRYKYIEKALAEKLLSKGKEVAVHHAAHFGGHIVEVVAMRISEQNRLNKALEILHKARELSLGNCVDSSEEGLDAAYGIFTKLAEQKRFFEAMPFGILAFERLCGSGCIIKTIADKVRPKGAKDFFSIKHTLMAYQVLLEFGFPKDLLRIFHAKSIKDHFLDSEYLKEERSLMIRLLFYHEVTFGPEYEENPKLQAEIRKQKEIAEKNKKQVAEQLSREVDVFRSLKQDVSIKVEPHIRPNPMEVVSIVTDYLEDQIKERELLKKCLKLDPDFGFDPDELVAQLK